MQYSRSRLKVVRSPDEMTVGTDMPGERTKMKGTSEGRKEHVTIKDLLTLKCCGAQKGW